jgi:cell division protein FtsI/penicillin-binding protein 2
VSQAIAGSCNAYFRRLGAQVSAAVFASTLRKFGLAAPAAGVDASDMTGFGDRLPLSPVGVLRAYLELSARRTQAGVGDIVRGMQASAATGTGRAVGRAVGGAAALVKTGTAPCIHAQHADGDGYAVVLFPADRPRVALLVQAHGHTGAETAAFAADILQERLAIR